MEANDNDLGWEIFTKDDCTYLLMYNEETLINLGPKEAVFDKLADYLGLPGDSIDVGKTEGEPDW